MQIKTIPMVYFKEIEKEFNLTEEDFIFVLQEDGLTDHFFFGTNDEDMENYFYSIEVEKTIAEKYGFEADEKYIGKINNNILLAMKLRDMGCLNGVLISFKEDNENV